MLLVYLLTSIAIIACVLLAVRWIIRGPEYTSDIRIDGKVVIVTGCNTGIGKETALDLARRGGKIYMVCRNYEKCEVARLEIVAKSGNNNIYNYEMDLASLDSIRAFVSKFREKEKKLDILINNAGIWGFDRFKTKDGVEGNFGVNFLGPFYLTTLLLDLLKAAAPSRIIMLSSVTHRFFPFNRDIEYKESSYNNVASYARSKLASNLFAYELSKRLKGTGVTINAVNPGSVYTELARYYPLIVRIFLIPIYKITFKSANNGAQTTLYAALDPKIATVSGRYFADNREQLMGFYAYQAIAHGDAKWLWQECEKLIDESQTKVESLSLHAV